jgi:hypothetical protein
LPDPLGPIKPIFCSSSMPKEISLNSGRELYDLQMD